MQDQVVGIPGFDGYGATRDGRIWTRVLPGPERRLGQEWSEIARWKAGRPCTYLYVQLFLYSRKIKTGVHRLILLTFSGPPLEGQQCRHLNGDSHDNRIENLTWGTRCENMQDKVRHGTSSPRRKVTSEVVEQIVRDRESGMFWREIGKKHSLHMVYVQGIFRRWKESGGSFWTLHQETLARSAAERG